MNGHFVTEAQAIYWQPRENGLAFAIVNKGSSSSLQNGKVKNPDFDYRLGFKVAVGYYIPHDDWGLFAQFTHFHARTLKSLHQKENTFIFPVWTNPILGSGFVETAKAHWRLHLGYGDLDLRKTLCISDYMSIEPLIGLKYAEIRHKYKINYSGGSLLPNSEDSFNMKNKYWGIGPAMGFNLFWNFCSCFGLISSVKNDFIFGTFYIHQSERIKNEANDHLKLFDKFFLPRFILESKMALCWKKQWVDKNLFLALTFGWEMQKLFGQNQLIRFLDQQAQGVFVSNLGDLTLQGWTFGVEIQF